MENLMLDKISSNEYDMMSYWRSAYAWSNDEPIDCRSLPVRDILKIWAREKKDLFTLFGEELVLTKKVQFEKSYSELYEDIDHMFSRYGDFGRSGRKARPFYDAYRDWYQKCFPIVDEPYLWDPIELTDAEKTQNAINTPIRDGLYDLMCYNSLITNEYCGRTFTIPLKDGRNYVVQTGCKPMKALAKIASSYDIPYFEDFRICHSQVHNQKRLTGELHISIHPFDYWTMSDNASGWDSCMNWKSQGGYRAGTVEMMNSSSVIVAYLSGTNPMEIYDENTWNNKKWRQLFIVHKDLIFGIKDYPYHNDNLSKEVINWLRELAEKNMGWKYTTDEPISYQSENKYSNPMMPEAKDFYIYFHSNRMYNDVGSCPYHPLYIGSEIIGEEVRGSEKMNYDFNYSGPLQCVSCGELTNMDDDCCVCCSECEEALRCQECGERIWDELYDFDGYRLCSDCYNDLVVTCEGCDTEVWEENANNITIFVKPTEKIKGDYENSIKLFSLYCDKNICDGCLNTFEEDYLKPDKKMFHFTTRWGPANQYGIFAEDLNDEGLLFLPARVRYTIEGKEKILLEECSYIKTYGDYINIMVDDVNVDQWLNE